MSESAYVQSLELAQSRLVWARLREAENFCGGRCHALKSNASTSAPFPSLKVRP